MNFCQCGITEFTASIEKESRGFGEATRTTRNTVPSEPIARFLRLPPS